jgi:uncharacterized membrane protein
MSTTNPILLAAAIFLILVGLTYPFFVLWRLNRQLSGSEAPANRQLAVTLALTALVPITAVLAGFWLVVPAARASLLFTVPSSAPASPSSPLSSWLPALTVNRSPFPN